MDVAQEMEDILEELAAVQKAINKLKTASVSGTQLRNRIRAVQRKWLPVCGNLEAGNLIDAGHLQEVSNAWSSILKLTKNASPKAQYRPLLKLIIAKTESELLNKYIKASAIQTIGDPLRKLVQPISDQDLLRYLDEAIRAAEANCIKASVVLAWCAVAFKIHQTLARLTMPVLTSEMKKMKEDKGLMFRGFTKEYAFNTEPDIQEAADAHLVLLCRFLAYLDDTQYKGLRNALDLRNGCGHPTGYEPDPVKLQAYFSDITQLVLLNPKFA